MINPLSTIFFGYPHDMKRGGGHRPRPPDLSGLQQQSADPTHPADDAPHADLPRATWRTTMGTKYWRMMGCLVFFVDVYLCIVHVCYKVFFFTSIAIYTHAHTHIYIYTHMHTHAYTHTHIYIYIYLHIYTYVYVCLYIHTYIYIYIYL